MPVQLDQAEITAFDGTTQATMTPAASAAPRGVRIEVTAVSRRVRVRKRAERTLLDGVSFTLSPGELVAIVGPSGAGKTTLLEVIAGIAPATSGSVHFDGVDLHANFGDLPQRARLRTARRHHPRRLATPAHAPLRSAATAPVVDERDRHRPRGA